MQDVHDRYVAKYLQHELQRYLCVTFTRPTAHLRLDSFGFTQLLRILHLPCNMHTLALDRVQFTQVLTASNRRASNHILQKNLLSPCTVGNKMQ